MHACMQICMHVCMHVCTYDRVCVSCFYGCMQTCVHVCMVVCMHVCNAMGAFMHAQFYLRICMWYGCAALMIDILVPNGGGWQDGTAHGTRKCNKMRNIRFAFAFGCHGHVLRLRVDAGFRFGFVCVIGLQCREEFVNYTRRICEAWLCLRKWAWGAARRCATNLSPHTFQARCAQTCTTAWPRN